MKNHRNPNLQTHDLLSLCRKPIYTTQRKISQSGDARTRLHPKASTILCLPGPSKPVADEQMEKVRAILENHSITASSLIENFPKTTASQDILEEMAPLPSSSNKERKRTKSVQVKISKLITSRTSGKRLENGSKNGTKI
ncbi:hypothetical protein AVEN_77147-1 [Araneus ventricosus]|uniref:Uncharacterized protein n=1 Tax=Araneus ventricosus TaxID=182803 RepID=A0A4Y2T186_ARAVE|nr:hypothetical protein AVEN_265847-1 [Araneus ventricosus]GBN93266.1 hypothetical protein AVEN_77147-1 [Araneus ventricosus]